MATSITETHPMQRTGHLDRTYSNNATSGINNAIERTTGESCRRVPRQETLDLAAVKDRTTSRGA
jgi:hypothetical protein